MDSIDPHVALAARVDRGAPNGREGSMRVSLVACVLAGICIAVALMLFLRREPPASMPSLASMRASAPDRASQVETDSTESVRRTRQETAATRDLEAPDASKLRGDDTRAEIRGRFVSIDGTPVSGVAVELNERSTDGDRAQAQGAREQRRIPPAISDEHGRFSIVFVPGRAQPYELAATHEGFCSVQWSWDSIDAAESKDVGLIVLLRGGTIAGRVLGPDGLPMKGTEWTVTAAQPLLGIATRRSTVDIPTRTDASTGAYVLRDVPPGPTQLRADREGTSRFLGPIVDVRSDETLHVDLNCRDAGVSSRISVFVSCPPYVSGPHVSLSAAQVDSIGLSGVGRTLVADAPKYTTQPFTFDGLEPGEYSLRVEDPRYLPWSRDAVAPGTIVDARLKGSASVRLSLTDAASGAPITRCSVHAEVEDTEWKWWVSSSDPLCEDCDLSLSNGIVDGLLPIGQTLVVSASGFADAYVHEDPLRPGEVRDVSVRMSRGATLSGRVFDGERGALAKHATVRLQPPRSNHESTSQLIEDSSDVLVTTIGASDGRFSFARLRPGVYRVQASSSLAIHSSITEVRIAGEETPSDVELVLPAATRLRGRILAPAGSPFSEVRLLLACKAFPLTQANISPGDFIPIPEWRQRLAISIGPDGRFESGPLPTGEAHARLMTPDSDLPYAMAAARHTDGKMVDLGALVLSPGEWNEHDFDMRASFPGTIRVALDLNRPSRDCVVEACVATVNYRSSAGGAVLEGDDVRIGPVPPGDYAIVVRSLDETWNWISPTFVHLNPGEELAQRYRIDLLDGVLKLRVAGVATPDFSKGVNVQLEASLPLEKLYLYPDAQGNLRLVLPAGRYSIRDPALDSVRPPGSTHADSAVPRSDSSVIFDWPLADDRAAEILFPNKDG